MCLIVFPEGVWNKSPNALSLELWPGIYRIACETGAKIVPIVHYIYDFSEHNTKVIAGIDGKLFLPVSVIYGPNGGGKSNVLEAIHALASKVRRPLCVTCDKTDCAYKARKIPVEPFALTEENRESPTEFELFFRTGIAEYRYILHVQKEVILYEKS